MAIRYYLTQDCDPNIKVEIDLSDCPVDDSGNVSQEDAALSAIDQIGYTLHHEIDDE